MPKFSEPQFDEDSVRSDLTEQQFVDFRTGLVRISYDANFVSYLFYIFGFCEK